MLFIDAEQRRQRRIKADMTEAVASGYSGVRVDPRGLERQLERLRKD